jgi:PAS domain S-box-containing protein
MRSPQGNEVADPPLELSATAILESVEDAFLAFDRQWRVSYVNRQAERLLEKSREQLLGKSLWDCFPEAAGTAFEREYTRAFATGKSVQFVEFYPPLRRWFDVRAFPAENHLTVSFHDITEQHQSDEALTGSRERLDPVLRSVDVGLWYCDLPFDRLVWNDRTKAHFWLPPNAEVTIHTFFERIHPEDRERTRQEIQNSITERRSYDIEYRTVAPEGAKIKWIRALGRAFYDRDGKPVRFDGVTVDVTPQKALLSQEQQWRAQAEMLNQIGRALSAELDLEKLVQMITDAGTKLTGAKFGAFFYNILDASGESYMLYTLSGVPREAFARYPMPRNTHVFAPTFRGEGVVRSDDITKDERYGKNPPYNGMPSGHLPVRSYLAVPVVSRGGDVMGGLFFGHEKVGVFTDDHERIVIALASQAATAMDNARLFTAVEGARKEAENNATALLRSNAELQQVAYAAAHDLQEPLRTIASFTQLAERRFRLATGSESDELVDNIVNSVQRMQVLLNGLLEFTSVSAEEQRPRDTVDLQEVFEECAQSLSHKLKETQGVVQAPSRLPLVYPGNRSQLKVLLCNLIDNALQYMRPGVPPEVLVTCEQRDSTVTFAVRDNGQGFSPEYRKQIFGMFKRLHGHEVPGTGIGLALCRRIVEAHRGTIWAESEPNRGTTIFFTLPSVDAAAHD